MSDITDPFASGKFQLKEDPIKLGDNLIPDEVMPFMVGKVWDQWCDEVIYDADKRMRKWLRLMGKNKVWRKSKMDRTYMFGELFELLYGRPYDASKGGDTKHAKKLQKMFAYYCTSIKPSCYHRRKKKWVNRKGYVIAVQGVNRPAYSIRLRVEEYMEQGKALNWHAIQLPKDDLKVGHSRDPRTEKNMQWRRELQRERYREYKRRWNAAHAGQETTGELGDSGRVPDEAVSGQDDRRSEQDEGAGS